jgi:hypothetical protein
MSILQMAKSGVFSPRTWDNCTIHTHTYIYYTLFAFYNIFTRRILFPGEE